MQILSRVVNQNVPIEFEATHHHNKVKIRYRSCKSPGVSDSPVYAQSRVKHPPGQEGLGYQVFPSRRSRIRSCIQHRVLSSGNVLNLIGRECRIPEGSSTEYSARNGRLWGTGLTLKTFRVSLPPWSNFRNVGFALPRTFWSIGSRVLMVLDNGLALTTQTRVFPRHTPALKKEMCEAMRLALLRPAAGSLTSRASRGKVITWRSEWNV